jgi:hypothetical protein
MRAKPADHFLSQSVFFERFSSKEFHERVGSPLSVDIHYSALTACLSGRKNPPRGRVQGDQRRSLTAVF